MTKFSGIEGISRGRLVEILRNSKPIIKVSEAAEILGLPATTMAKMMARWVEQGWLVRVRRGTYMAVPPEARSPNEVSEDPFIVASSLFDPCYLGGWTAAEQWGLTEQIFRTILVVTTRNMGSRRLKIRSSEFLVRTTSPSRFFGTKVVWRDNVKINFSDPTKTVIDTLNDPAIAGGSRMLSQILDSYLTSKGSDFRLMLDYGKRMNNGAILKRLGFLLEQSEMADSAFLSEIRENLTSGNSKLDPRLPCEKLVTRWRLFIPRDWSMTTHD